ncbi:MAG: DUF5916 domain-containing protein [Gemmatimonadales bacterium]
MTLEVGHHNRTTTVLYLVAVLSGYWSAVDAQEPAGRRNLPPAPSYEIRRASGTIEIDGVMDEVEWDRADAIALSWEFLPGDNIPARVETVCRLTFDSSNLYFGCHASDPRPQEIRAHYADRDDRARLPQDDHVVLLIDPFNDERRGFQFRVNAAGVQMDAVLVKTEGFEDFSWNAIWTSAARIMGDGYEVEAAIPFRSLRFPSTTDVQTWGVIIERSYPRNLRYRMRSAPTDRNSTCILCWANKVTGFQDIAPGTNVEVVPTLTALRTQIKTPFPGGSFEPKKETGLADVDPDFGADLRWGITPNMSLNGTYNPDFSQVEADVAQLAVNRRFELFFPEKRPFFLEGADFFLTPLQAVFTRTIADPDGGVKLTGKTGANAIGIVTARDATTNLLFPTNQGSSAGAIVQDAYSGIVRYRRDVGQSSYVGALYTGRGGTDYQNQVYGADAFYQISRSNSFRLQYLRSNTEYPDVVAQANGQPAGNFTGGGLSAQFAHASRNWLFTARYSDLSPDFRADLGFIPRVDVRTGSTSFGHVFWGPTGGWFTRIQTIASYSRTENHDGALTDDAVRVDVAYQGPSQSTAALGAGRLTQVVRGVNHDLNRANVSFQVRPSGSVVFGAGLKTGDFVDFVNNRTSFGLSFTPSAQFDIGRRIAFTLSHVLQRLNFNGQKVFTANLTQGKLLYHFNTRTFVRAIVQYRIVHRDPALYTVPVAATTERAFTQFLFSYKVNPQTALFLGYTDNLEGSDQFSLERKDRTLFLKFGYALRP